MRIYIKYLFLSVLLLGNVLKIFPQQPSTIQGRITDENKRPLPHVNIFLSDSKIGTVTNSNGAFSLSFSGKEDMLTASFIGYETQTVKVDKNTGFIKIKLKPSPIALDEVVISSLSAADLLKKAIEKIPYNYPQQPFLSKAYYRAKLSEKDTLRYLEETMFNIVKSYRPGFSDKYFLVKNRNFRFVENHGSLRQIGNFDMVKMVNLLFDAAFFKNYTVRYLPCTTFDNKSVYVLSLYKEDEENSSRGTIYIDTEDLAFVRFDLDFKNGDKKTAQYKKIDDKYYLMSGNSLHLNKRFNRIFPAEADMLITAIIPDFSKESIEGTLVDTEDVLEAMLHKHKTRCSGNNTTLSFPIHLFCKLW